MEQDFIRLASLLHEQNELMKELCKFVIEQNKRISILEKTLKK